MLVDARMARKLNSGIFDVKQYAEHPPVIHLCYNEAELDSLNFMETQKL